MVETTALIGEPLALDLVNTRTAGADLLASPAQLAGWLALEAERAPELAGMRADGAALAAVRDAREHALAVFTALLAGRRPPAPALRGLQAALDAAPSRARVGWDGQRVTLRSGRAGPAAARLGAVLAEAAVTLLADPAIGTLRRCAADDCVLLFLPAHPRRRWCSPDRCGNRVRVARYYERRRNG